MTEHDPICTRFRRAVDEPFQPCICGELREARAGEQERTKTELRATAKWCREDERATLRAQVMSVSEMWSLPGDYEIWIKRSDVLAMLDGSDGE